MKDVLIVEDQRMMRESMENYIRQSGRYRLAASIANAGLAESCCERQPVDLVLMDVCTENDESGFEATRKIKARFPNIRVIIVTSMLDCGYLSRAREVNADSIWFKDASQEELMNVVDRTMNGESVYPDRTPQVQLGYAGSYEFSEAELRVLRLLVEGMTYRQMAEALGVSADTVKAHVSSMLSKTGFTSKTKLAAVVISKKLIVNGF
ncbi:MAG: response regulator transcription factor [Lachnospiraceae bacterium]|nr:response regulator transcription factor [Lachnospiraceae bacterium]